MRLRISFATLVAHSLQRLETHMTELDRRWIWGHAVRTLLVLALALCCFGCLGKFFRIVCRVTECSLEKKKHVIFTCKRQEAQQTVNSPVPHHVSASTTRLSNNSMLSRDRKKDQESNCGFDVSVRKDMVDGTCSVDQHGATTTAVNTLDS